MVSGVVSGEARSMPHVTTGSMAGGYMYIGRRSISASQPRTMR